MIQPKFAKETEELSGDARHTGKATGSQYTVVLIDIKSQNKMR